MQIGRTPFDRQIEYFADIKAKLASMMDSSAQHFISEALFYINIGSYDYVSNYFLPDSKVSQLYSVGKYQQLLLSRFADQLKVDFSNFIAYMDAKFSGFLCNC